MIRVKLSKANQWERGEREWVRERERRSEHMENTHVFLQNSFFRLLLGLLKQGKMNCW